MVLVQVGTVTRWDWYRMGFDTVELVQDWTAIQGYWYRMGLRHGGTGTVWDCDTMGLVQDGTAIQWN